MHFTTKARPKAKREARGPLPPSIHWATDHFIQLHFLQKVKLCAAGWKTPKTEEHSHSERSSNITNDAHMIV